MQYNLLIEKNIISVVPCTKKICLIARKQPFRPNNCLFNIKRYTYILANFPFLNNINILGH